MNSAKLENEILGASRQKKKVHREQHVLKSFFHNLRPENDSKILTFKNEPNSKIFFTKKDQIKFWNPFHVISTIHQWIWCQNYVNPLWVFIEDRTKIKKSVVFFLKNFDLASFKTANPESFLASKLIEAQHLQQTYTRPCYSQMDVLTAMFGKRYKDNENHLVYLSRTDNRNCDFNRESLRNHDRTIIEIYKTKILSLKQLQLNQYPIPNDQLYSTYITLKPRPSDQIVGLKNIIYAIDCEMIITTQGSELARVSVVNYYGEVIFDSLVKPDNAVVNYNTKFSGITEQMLNPITTRLADVQEELSKILFQDCILIGHSLENDLHALKIVHSNIIDTSVLFLLPYGGKQSLKSLAFSYLKIKIQEDEHDSTQDARVAMAVAKLKLEILNAFTTIPGKDFKDDLPALHTLLVNQMSFHIFSKKDKLIRFNNHPSITVHNCSDIEHVKQDLYNELQNTVAYSTKSITLVDINCKNISQESILQFDDQVKKLVAACPNTFVGICTYGRPANFSTGGCFKDQGEVLLLMS